MITPIILYFLGLLLILIEFYLPGAIMGTLGGIALLASIFLLAQTQAWWIVLLFTSVVIISVILLVRFALWRIVHAKPGQSIYLREDQEGYQASSFDEATIGKVGLVMSDLKPGGYIIIDGKQHQAISLTGYVVKDEKVIVVRGQEESLIVKSITKENES